MSGPLGWIVACGPLVLAALTAVNVWLTREIIRAPWRCVFRLKSFGRDGDDWVAEIENLGPGPATGVRVWVPLAGARGRRPAARAMRGPGAIDSDETLQYRLPCADGRVDWGGYLTISHRTVCGERRRCRLPIEEPENRPVRSPSSGASP
ncbi:MAG: hypothetical protein IRZ18_04080 [Clostridia bacterium]|nr:hypothetical protein [Clostridia bacterium]